MAVATQASVLLGTLTGVLHLFRIFPAQPNARVVAHALLSALTVLLLFVSGASGHFSSAGIGLLAFIASLGALGASVLVYRNDDPRLTPGLVGGYFVLQLLTMVFVLGAAGLGAFR